MESLFDRPQSGEKAVLVHVELPDETEREDSLEFEMLVESAGAEICGFIKGRRQRPDSRYFVGLGKMEEIAGFVKAEKADIVIFNHALSPAQERNLERAMECRVLDRTSLILDIFAQRARTFEGKLQVELAQLEHISARLVRGWTHLERQKGGIGLRGPGETQLETDRRLLRARIKAIHKRLGKVRSQRAQGRRSRKKAEVPTVSLVGYTNAGKSTLFNRLTASRVYVADQLFATLDPTLRRLEIEDVGPVILADTVGFIRHLPHKLVEAFRATLEEIREAELLMHVVDACADDRDGDIAQVASVLNEIDASGVPQLMVYNKIDLLGGGQPRIDRDEQGKPYRVWLSAQTGLGCNLLVEAIQELLSPDRVHYHLRLDAGMGQLRSRFYQLGAVVAEEVGKDGGFLIEVKLPSREFKRLLKRTGTSLEELRVKK